MQNFDVLVVGAGFAGATIARKKAEQGKKVLIIDKREHVGGNMYEKTDENQVILHLYGPHIFHTNNEEVFNYLKKFSKFFKYEHKVLGKINGKFVPIPFNFTSLEMLFDTKKSDEIKLNLQNEFPKQEKSYILDLINSKNNVVKEFGKFVYKNVFENYTSKQWGLPISKIDTSVINRVPVILGYDDRYFNDKYQYMPINGFNNIFENMLKHKNITVELNTNVKDKLNLDFINLKTYWDNIEYNGEIYYTGAIDELLDYKYGLLPYRTLELKFERYNVTYFQSNSVINYPNEEEFTRITEFKYLTKQKLEEHTTILKEFPAQYDINNKKHANPYYPIINKDNIDLYNRYKSDIENFSNITLCGRLAEYKYYNMDAVIARALDICK